MNDDNTVMSNLVAPDDYFAISEDLTFSATEIRICRDVTSVEDDILEDDEGLILILSTDGPSTILEPSEATVTILDDDSRSSAMLNCQNLCLYIEFSSQP